MNRYQIDWDAYKACARRAAADGAVLLKNDRNALPLTKGKVAVFGRSQFNYYKSGTGSGGAVNTRPVDNIIDALQKESQLQINGKLLATYQEWLIEHPFEKGEGWASEPWSQQEMPLTENLVKEVRKASDIAILVIGRTAGEDQDNTNSKGSFLLTDAEEDMLRRVCASFERTIVLLNVGNIIDMKWVDTYDPAAVMYVWQGGQEGAGAVADLLMGRVCPSGKLTDTIARDIEDYPSTADFGGEDENLYHEDIYVGYRYFETFAKDQVLYPFGFGLSYTSFEIRSNQVHFTNNGLEVTTLVKNIGTTAGREVVQVYISAPQGKLGKPSRVLGGFAKTSLIEPGKESVVTVSIPESRYASYDDSGITGHKACFVLEEGLYKVYVGTDVRSAGRVYKFNLEELKVLEECREALAPVKRFTRIKPVNAGSGDFKSCQETVPTRSYDLNARMLHAALPEIPYTGDQGIKLVDVLDGKASMEQFLSQLSDEELCCIVRGEGMSSPKVTPGTASAFGGVSKRLSELGVPVACCADGPSGIRMDCGTIAFSLPNGTCLASTFDPEMNRELFAYEGAELRKNRIDTLLGPGINIHRNPLNGRNFEYFSEDPLVTGLMASAQLSGLHEYGVTGTIKHFAGNNQEKRRRFIDSVISERALREIYLKGFEIAVKEGGAFSIMTTYGALNGLWTAGNFDLNTTILRDTWGFRGIVMTDWWAAINDEGCSEDVKNTSAMVRAQNDLYMVVTDSEGNSMGDNLAEGLSSGKISRGHLLRSAINILIVVMKLPVMDRFLDRISEEEKSAFAAMAEDEKPAFDLEFVPIGKEAVIATDVTDTDRGVTKIFGITVDPGSYRLSMKVRINASAIAQVPVSFSINTRLIGTVTMNGTDGAEVTVEQDLGFLLNSNNVLKLFFAQGGMQISEIRITQTQAADLSRMFQ